MTRTYFISRLSSTEILIKELSLVCYFESFCIYQMASEVRMPFEFVKASKLSRFTIENCLENLKKVLTY